MSLVGAVSRQLLLTVPSCAAAKARLRAVDLCRIGRSP